MSKKYTIGTNAITYPEIRNFAGLNFKDYQFKRVIDAYKIPSYIQFKLLKKLNRKWQNSFNDLGINKVSFFHFFNVINLGKKPFITTYETTIPRWQDKKADFEKGLSILAQPNCIKIIALSQCAYTMQQACIEKYAPQLLSTIINKNCVMLPPQKPFIKNYAEKQLDSDYIVFTMVGADFFRKGGQAVLQAFDILLAQNRPIKLNIVSTLNYGDYASKTTIQDKEYALEIIKKYPANIFHYNYLSGMEIENILIKTNVALLPSLAETFGYFILEAQAAACPVITTDIRAMPEINTQEKGWLIAIKKENSFDADISKPQILTDSIAKQLTAIIDDIIQNPETIVNKGESALQDIVNNHSIDNHKEKLLAIYESINS